MASIELLAPARNLATGIAAIRSGADAVYIGAQFSARAAAQNSMDDIAALIKEAHLYHARVYLALNTILREEELEPARQNIIRAWEKGIDALIFQDMAILEMDIPPIPLHASTQCNNRTSKDIEFLSKIGVQRAILARELSLKEIRQIKNNHPNIELEFFIHGALCVSFSGRCYLSYATTGRSANRGECAQPCRMYYDLKDSQGKTIAHHKHLLSMKDLNLSNSLEDLIDAGISSLKIEGRLKGADYVKNIVSYYRKKLDPILKRKGLSPASDGKSISSFSPNPSKSFSRGFTSYFLHNPKNRVASIHTQKSIGESIGIVKEIHYQQKSFRLQNPHDLHEQDGICFFDEKKRLHGTKIIKIKQDQIVVQDARRIQKNTLIYRNHDIRFKKELQNQEPKRLIPISAILEMTPSSLKLVFTDGNQNTACSELHQSFEKAEKTEKALENIRKQISKLGNTPFELKHLVIKQENQFLPFVSIADINQLRRNCTKQLIENRLKTHPRKSIPIRKNNTPYFQSNLSYEYNILNSLAEKFYRRHGIKKIEKAAEGGTSLKNRVLMTTRHCILNELGYCEQKKRLPFREPLFLIGNNNQKFRLSFDCKRCEMKVHQSD